MYYNLLIGSIPLTRIISYNEFKKERKGRIKDYILTLLQANPNGLDTRQISELSGIWVQSLTAPLHDLTDKGKIVVSGIHKSEHSNRLVQLYSLPK